MSNPSKRKGSAWEGHLLHTLRGYFGNAERSALAGVNDEGDLWFHWNGKPYVIEAKAERSFNLSAYVTEAAVEAKNWWKARRHEWPEPRAIAIVKRRNHSATHAYVVMTLEEFVKVVKG